MHQRLPEKKEGKWGKLGTANVCVIPLSGPVFASIMATVVQVWTEDRSSSVHALRPQTHMHLSEKLGKGSHKPFWLQGIKSSLILHRDVLYFNLYSALKRRCAVVA